MNIDQERQRRGLELKVMRIKKMITQDDLSKLSGLTKKTIGKIERGDTGWNIDSEIIYLETLKNLAS